MIWRSDKRSACASGFICLPVLLCLVLPAIKVSAQDTISLKAVEVTTSRNSLAQHGKRTEPVDSLVKEQFRFNSIADVLNFNSQVFIKSYGPGALASTAFRGGNASQTAVLWNGFNLQNAMLGETDLSLMPSMLFENVEVEYGGSSALWGSGAVGGSIHLNNKSLFGQGLCSRTDLSAASFRTRKAATAFTYSKERFVSSTKLYLQNSRNNYVYRDTTDGGDTLRQRNHAGYDFKGLMQEFKFLVNPRQVLGVNAWLNSNNRELPSYNYFTPAKTYQTDNAVRVSANWTYIKSAFRSAVKGAYFYDRINYTDSLQPLFSKSRVATLIAENENYLDWGRNNQFNTGISVSNSEGRTENYRSVKSISKVALLAGNKFSLIQSRLTAYAAVRAEYFSVGRLPLTGNVSLQYKPFNDLVLGANAARVYRHPTLNQLYWVPGGNVNLKPEEGYSFEGNARYKHKLKRWLFQLSASAYSRVINNWILWVPGAGNNPVPLNVQQGWSRGTETSWKLNYAKRKFFLGTGFMSSYVLSTVTANSQENNASVNRQLIYTPRYSFSGNISLGFRKTYFTFYHQYTGYRFITSDNTGWLPPHHVSSLRFSHAISLVDAGFSFFLAVNNLINTNYAVISGRPMPLRNFEIGVTLKAHRD